MSLVQLTVKGESEPRRRRKNVVGIDLGTTNSLVATVIDGEPKVIEDFEGNRITPSAVRYGKTGVAVGREALEAQARHPEEVVTSVKRLMGRSREDAQRKYHYSYADGDGMARIVAGGKELSPVEVSADILRHLTATAGERWLDDGNFEDLAVTTDQKIPDASVEHEEAAHARLDGAVITVPAYFDDAQRQATKDAARLAGIEVLRLLNEPTAAALAYGLESGEQGVYVVYDLGGGTFDVSVLRLSKGVFEVLGTAGDSSLGGDDFDEALARLAYEKAEVDFPDGTKRRLALHNARRVKEALSESDRATVTVITGDGTAKEVEVSADEFIEAVSPLTKRTLSILDHCVRESCPATELKGVIMVGGATRMPHLRKAVAELMPAPLHTDINPDEVVAIGAASQADILAGNRPSGDWLLLDVTPLSLGIETMGGLVEKIIPRNSAIPVARAQEFTTHKDGQSAMSIHVLQGERELVSDCRSLARFSVKGIPPMPAGTARIRVTYRADADGILSVTAREMKTGTETGIEVKPSYGLTEDEVVGMLRSATDHAKEDIEARARSEARIEAQSLRGMLATALEGDAEAAGRRPARDHPGDGQGGRGD